MFQSLKRDHSSSDIAMFQGNVYVCTLKFQSLKRDHSSSDLLWKDSLASSSKVSIAQARPFLFRPDLSMRGNFADSSFNRSSATIPLPTASAEFLSSDLRSKFQSLKRDHSSSDTRAMGRPLRLRSSRVSIAQARPFLFRPFYRKTMDDRDAWFQSLKRDHSSSDSKQRWCECQSRRVSIAQARPFLFRPPGSWPDPGSCRRFQSLKRDHSSSDVDRIWPGLQTGRFQSLKRDHSSSDLEEVGLKPEHGNSFNRSSATIPLPTRRSGASSLRSCTSFNRSSATIPLPTQFQGRTGAFLLPFQSLKRDHSSSDEA